MEMGLMNQGNKLEFLLNDNKNNDFEKDILSSEISVCIEEDLSHIEKNNNNNIVNNLDCNIIYNQNKNIYFNILNENELFIYTNEKKLYITLIIFDTNYQPHSKNDLIDKKLLLSKAVEYIFKNLSINEFVIDYKNILNNDLQLFNYTHCEEIDLDISRKKYIVQIDFVFIQMFYFI